MCNLCNPDTRESELRRLHSMATRMRDLARDFERMASGEVKPHMDYARTMAASAHVIIRELVEDYV